MNRTLLHLAVGAALASAAGIAVWNILPAVIVPVTGIGLLFLVIGHRRGADRALGVAGALFAVFIALPAVGFAIRQLAREPHVLCVLTPVALVGGLLVAARIFLAGQQLTGRRGVVTRPATRSRALIVEPEERTLASVDPSAPLPGQGAPPGADELHLFAPEEPSRDA